MNTLDLQALGLEEMNEVQMMDVDGGIWRYVVKLIEAAGIVDGIYEFGSGFVDGFRNG